MKVGRGRDVKFGSGTAVEEAGVRSKFKIYKRIVKPKQYTQAHEVAEQPMVALNQ